MEGGGGGRKERFCLFSKLSYAVSVTFHVYYTLSFTVKLRESLCHHHVPLCHQSVMPPGSGALRTHTHDVTLDVEIVVAQRVHGITGLRHNWRLPIRGDEYSLESCIFREVGYSNVKHNFDDLALTAC